MKRLLYDFATNSINELPNDANEEAIYLHMKQNKYRFMYIYFN